MTINNVAPTVTLNAVAMIDENGVATLTGTIADPGTLDTFTLDINWGDPVSPGNVQQYAFSASATGSQTFALTRQYLDDDPTATPQDSYTINVSLTDDDTGSAAASASTIVNNVAPVAADQSYTTLEDAPITFNVLAGTDDVGPFTVTDVGTLDTHTAVAGTFATAAGGNITIAAGGDATYTPAPGFAGQDTFNYSVEDDDTGSGTAMVTVTVLNLVDLSGRVFDDRDNDGVFEPGDGDTGIENVVMELVDESGGSVVDTTTTAVDGTYAFSMSDQGTYTVRQQTQPTAIWTVANQRAAWAVRWIIPRTAMQ